MDSRTLKREIAARVAYGSDLRCLLAFPVSAEGLVGEPIDALKGESLGDKTRAGSVLGRLMGIRMDNGARWAVVGLQPAGQIRLAVEAGHRILAASNLVDFPLAGVFLSNGGKVHEITFSAEA